MTGLHKHPLRSNNLHNRYTSNSPVESSTTRSSSNTPHFQRNSITTAATTAISSTTATSTAVPAKATFLSPAPLAQKIAIPTVNNSSHQTGASGESGSGNAGQPRTSYAALQHLASGGAAVGPTTRERTAQCVDYYNSQVLRARLQAGLTTLASDRNHNIPSYPNERNSIPASSNERSNNSLINHDRNSEGERNSGRTIPHQHNNNSFHHHVRRQLYQPHANHQDVLYRSTSSLELQEHIYLQHNHHHHHYHNPVTTTNTPVLRREYGSHGSINVVGTEPRPSPVVGTSESFFAMLQDYRPATLIGVDQRSPGPTEYLRVNAEQPPASLTSVSNIQQTDEVQTEQNVTPRPASPKLKHKIQRLLGHNSNNSTSGKGLKSCASVQSDDGPSPSTPGTSPDIEERQRRRCFAHYDCQSMTTNLSYAARLREQLLARRRNTTTGASAASMPNTRSSTPDGDCEIDNDTGDGISNDLVETCPFFRNEIGGEEERTISLTARQQQNRNCSTAGRPMHQPALAYGFALLDYSPGDTHWKRSTCPYQKLPRPIECVDQGALYYRTHFMGNEHQNYFGTDDQLGPVAISVRRERIAEEEKNGNSYHQYRIIIRTSELLTLRGTVLEESIPHLRVSSSGKIQSGAKEVLEYIAPEVQLSCLRLGVSSHHVEQLIATVDEQGLASQYKVGIMYCRAGQSTEEEMYNNENAGPAFIEFLGCLGKTVRLLGFPKYRAGLDNKSDSTGLYSVYAEHKNNEIMFHVSTMLPYSPNNRQQLLRKRHIGNDIVTIVFQEPGALPFTPKTIRSQFQHVFIVVKAINPCTENTHYQVAVTRSKDVPIFGPPIKEGAVYPKSKTFADFLLAKIINAENAAHQSEKFATMARRTRLEYIKDLINNHSTNIGIESGQKFTFFNKPKKEKSKPLQINHKRLTGAMCWQVLVDDNGLGQRIEAFLGISTDSIVLIEESSRQIIFVAPCTSILGYTAQTNSLKIYHHQGENFTIHIRETYSDRDELMEIVDRLKVLTPASVTQEMILRRDSSGNLGFHVQPDGLVTYVEPGSKAELSGLTKGARLVEVCKIALSTLSHEAMIDFLKTSETVTISMIPPVVEGEMRKGCPLQNCRYIVGLMESDYENLNNEDNSRSSNRPNAQSQHPVSNNHRRRYERSFSPPRSSSSSSGYGTGSSSKSFLGQDHRFPVNPEGTMTSSSSGHSSDDRWYELLETQEPETVLQGSAARVVISTPPPIPVRSTALTTNEVTPLQQSSSEISSSMQHLSSSSNHHEFHQQPHNHNRIQVSHSLPLPHANFSLPLNSSNITLGIPRDERKMKQTNGRDDYSSLADVRLQQQLMDNHEANEKLMNINIEDEIPSSGHSSPRRINKHRATTSNNNSRNQSPRPTQTETRLRPGVISRSNRNSANLSTSTLQEDLMKLINPDYMHEEDFQQSSNVIRQKSQIGENRTDQAEVIFTTARPATVISNASTASSPAPSDFKSCKEERISPRVSGNNNIPGNSVAPEPLPLPDEELDWSSLVDTATRAMQQVPKEIDGGGRSRFEYNERWLDEIELKDNATVTASASVPELQSHVSELESRVTLEQRRRKSLEEEIKRLREENRRLQDESQAAAHQLRRFTEWFFQTIDKQHDKQ